MNRGNGPFAWFRVNLIAVAGMAGMVVSAGLLKASEQITPAAIAFGVVGAGVLAVRWGRRYPRVVVVLAFDLALIFLYAWSLGPPSGLAVTVRATPQGLRADVGGNVFFQKGRAERAGLFASPSRLYVTTSNGGRRATGANPFSWIANGLRFGIAGPAWSDLSLRAAGARISLTAGDIQAGKGSWTTNPRGEIAGSLGAIGWLPSTQGSAFTVSGTLMRPDGTQGILLTDASGRNGFLLAIRMDHRDARFYYWRNGTVDGCTCSHPKTFQVSLTPAIQRVLRFLLPSLIWGMALILVAWIVFLIAVSMVGFVTGNRPWMRRIEPKNSFDAPTPATSWASIVTRRLEPLALVSAAILSALGVTSAALVALNNNQTLPTIEDTSTYIFQAKTLALGRLWAPIPSAFASFSLPFTVRFDGHWFGKYPPGWPVLLAGGQVFGHPWMVTPIVGGISLVIIFLIGRELYSPWLGVVAAGLALSSPFFLSMSASLLSQSATWLWCGLFAYLVIRWYRRSSFAGLVDRRIITFGWPLLAGGGIAIGLAFATRQLDALAVSLPFSFLVLRRPIGIAFVAAGSALPLGLLGLYNLAVTGNVIGGGYKLAESWDRLGFGTGGPTPYEAGFNVARAFWNIAYDLEHLQIGLFGWPFFLGLAVVAIPFVSGRARPWDWLLLASCVCLAGAYGLYWASGVTGGFPRYWFGMVPWLCILAARGVEELVRWPAATLKLRPTRPEAWGFPAILLAGLVFFDVHYFMPVNVLYYRNPAGAVVSMVRSAHLHNALIFQRQHSAQHSEYEVIFSQNSPLLNGNILWADDLVPRKNLAAMRAHPLRAYYLLNGLRLIGIKAPAYSGLSSRLFGSG